MNEQESKSRLQRDAFTMRETSQKLGISYITMHRLVKRGLIKPSTALRIKLFSQREIDRFLRDTQVP